MSTEEREQYLQDERIAEISMLKEEEYREAHVKEYLVKFKGTMYIEALDEGEALDLAQDKDLSEWVDTWEAN